MGIRRDPLAAAAEAISSVEQRCQGGKLNVRAEEAGEEEEQASRGRGSDPSLVCTVGSISVWPGASNVIPGSANFSVDIRSDYVQTQPCTLTPLMSVCPDMAWLPTEQYSVSPMTAVYGTDPLSCFCGGYSSKSNASYPC